MKDRLLFWIGPYLFHYVIAKSIADQYDCDLYGFADIDNEKKDFFENQKLVNFQKIWYYRDHVDLNKLSVDITYLKEFEKRYGINLWLIAYSERAFYKYNEYYQFSREEILSILQQTCKLFERILDEIRPTFLLLGATDYHHNYLLVEMCKKRNIDILMLGGSRFGFREIICEETDKIDRYMRMVPINERKYGETFEELQEYLYQYDNVSQLSNFTKIVTLTTKGKIKKLIKNLLVYGSAKHRNHFTRMGMTRLKILIKSITLTLSRYNTKKFANSNFKRNLDGLSPFVYFSLHSEPERILSIASPFFMNQLDVIKKIAQSLPVGYKLIVKDHPIMVVKGDRKVSFYKEIINLPNVEIVHTSIRQQEILKKCSLVITIAGTSGLEAAFYNKPSIILADTLYSSLPSVYRLDKFEDLPTAVRSSLDSRVNPNDLNKFINFIEQNSFQFDRHLVAGDLRMRVQNRKITEAEVANFMQEYDDQLTTLAKEHIKKINFIKSVNSQSKEQISS